MKPSSSRAAARCRGVSPPVGRLRSHSCLHRQPASAPQLPAWQPTCPTSTGPSPSALPCMAHPDSFATLFQSATPVQWVVWCSGDKDECVFWLNTLALAQVIACKIVTASPERTQQRCRHPAAGRPWNGSPAARPCTAGPGGRSGRRRQLPGTARSWRSPWQPPAGAAVHAHALRARAHRVEPCCAARGCVRIARHAPPSSAECWAFSAPMRCVPTHAEDSGHAHIPHATKQSICRPGKMRGLPDEQDVCACVQSQGLLQHRATRSRAAKVSQEQWQQARKAKECNGADRTC